MINCYTVHMNYLGIDYGTKRIGFAVGNNITGIATPLETRLCDEGIFAYIENIVRERDTDHIIIGDTKDERGNDNAVTPLLEKFIKKLKSHIEIPITSIGEQMTSREAARLSGFDGLARKNQDNQKGRQKFSGDTDASAAALILQRYLDTQQFSV